MNNADDINDTTYADINNSINNNDNINNAINDRLDLQKSAINLYELEYKLIKLNLEYKLKKINYEYLLRKQKY